MDKTVIEEIAAQLGMAADQAGELVAEHLPAFAALQTVKLAVPLAVSAVIAAAAAVCAFHLLRRTKQQMESDNASGTNQRWSILKNEYTDYPSFWVFVCLATIAVIAVFVFAIESACAIPEIIGWSCWPEAQLIDVAISAMGGK